MWGPRLTVNSLERRTFSRAPRSLCHGKCDRRLPDRGYNAACIAEDYDEEEAMSEQILNAIVEAGRPIFDQLAPCPVNSTSTSSNLHSLLFPKEYTFRFRTLDTRQS
jgi:hypothetical protein